MSQNVEAAAEPESILSGPWGAFLGIAVPFAAYLFVNPCPVGESEETAWTWNLGALIIWGVLGAFFTWQTWDGIELGRRGKMWRASGPVEREKLKRAWKKTPRCPSHPFSILFCTAFSALAGLWSVQVQGWGFAVVGTLFFFLGWLFFVALVLENLPEEEPPEATLLGNARLTAHEELEAAGFIGSSFGEGIRLGFERLRSDDYNGPGQVIRYKGPGNLITVAPPRAGKLRDVLAAALIEFLASLIVIDPKGQICAIIKRQREKLGPTFVLLPFYKDLEKQGVKLGKSARFNPLTTFDPASDTFALKCDGLAEGIVPEEPEGKNRFFTGAARNLISGFTIYIIESPRFTPEQKTLPYVYDRLTKEPFAFAREAFANGSDFVKQRVAPFTVPEAEKNNVINDVLFTARREMSFIGNAPIAESLSGSDFDFRDLKRGNIPTTIFVVIPAEFLGSVGSKWFRLIITAALKALLTAERDQRVLMVIDEFARISSEAGKLSVVRDAMSDSAGLGLQIWPIMQNLAQFRADFPNEWETFLAGCDVRQFFKPRENFTAEYISKLIGQRTVAVPGTSTSSGAGGKTSTFLSVSYKGQPLLLPDQILRMADDRFLMFASGAPFAISGCRAAYFDKDRCPELQGLYDPDPYERKAAPDDTPPPRTKNRILK